MGHNILLLSQPVRSSISIIFDKLSLFRKGRLLFRGAVSEMTAYFSSIGLPCPSHFNPVQYYSSLGVTDGAAADSSEQTKRLERIFHRRTSLEISHQRKLAHLIERVRRKEILSNIFHELFRRGISLIPSKKSFRRAAGWCRSMRCNIQQSIVNGTRSLQQLHSLAMNKTAQHRHLKSASQLSAAFSLSALTLGYANFIFGMVTSTRNLSHAWKFGNFSSLLM